ncbi:MAG: methyl-accepting chemotaxis protein [Saccharospirillum sp.]
MADRSIHSNNDTQTITLRKAHPLHSINNLMVVMILVFLIAALVITAQAYRGLSQQLDAYRLNYQNRMVPLSEVQDIGSQLAAIRSELLLSLQHDRANPFAQLHDHPTSLHTDRVLSHMSEIERLWQSFGTAPRGPVAARLASDFEQILDQLVTEQIRPIVDLINTEAYLDGNRRIIFEMGPLFNQTSQAQEALVNRLLEGAQESYEAMQATSGRLTLLLVLSSVLGIAIPVVLAIVILRNLREGIGRVTRMAAKMANGDLSPFQQTKDDKSELGVIYAAFTTARDRLRDAMTQLLSTAQSVSELAQESTRAAQHASEYVENQKQETDLVATAMHEMNVAVHEVAQNTEMAASNASQADQQAKDGQIVVADSVRSMESLAGDVEKAVEVVEHLVDDANAIGSIVNVISGIAEQTNLLALNAAIEAARAGEQGRGFAVVADEVRQLASRTQESTQQINEMISRLQSSVQNASSSMSVSHDRAQEVMTKAARADEALNAITRLISEINDMNLQIASTTEEQGKVAEEMNQNITRINQAADQTAQASAQSAQSSEQTLSLIQQLEDNARTFKVD